MKQPDFYDRFHKKNTFYLKIIGDRNFTYFYTLQFLQEPCMKPIARQRVLDVGCGVGTLSLYLAKKGARVVGVDISPQAIEIANHAKQANLIKTAVFKSGELQPDQPVFERVICTEVIEHISDDEQFLQTIHSNMRPGGVLLLTTPSQENWLYRHGFYRRFDQEVGHVRRYTLNTISQLLTKNGFKIIKIKRVEGPLRNLLFTTRLGFLIKFIKGPFVPLFHVFDRLSAQVWGASDIMILAVKI